jgi:hypothetical protein
MANRKKRIPKQGDHVVARGHKGAFVISSVDGDLCTAELKPTGRGFALSTIPWSALAFLDEEDASKAQGRWYRKGGHERRVGGYHPSHTETETLRR